MRIIAILNIIIGSFSLFIGSLYLLLFQYVSTNVKITAMLVIIQGVTGILSGVGIIKLNKSLYFTTYLYLFLWIISHSLIYSFKADINSAKDIIILLLNIFYPIIVIYFLRKNITKEYLNIRSKNLFYSISKSGFIVTAITALLALCNIYLKGPDYVFSYMAYVFASIIMFIRAFFPPLKWFQLISTLIGSLLVPIGSMIMYKIIKELKSTDNSIYIALSIGIALIGVVLITFGFNKSTTKGRF